MQYAVRERTATSELLKHRPKSSMILWGSAPHCRKPGTSYHQRRGIHTERLRRSCFPGATLKANHLREIEDRCALARARACRNAQIAEILA